MPTSKVTVYRSGRPAKGIRVRLEYSGLTQMGFTDNFYTDDYGIAYVQHTSTGAAAVYLNGKKKRSMRTPGEDIFYL